MDERIKALWVARLRSTTDRQNRNGLLRPLDGSYDPLGLLCEISGVSQWELNGDCYKYDDCVASLSPEVLKSTQLTEAQEDEIIHLNDAEKLSFSDIANFIEENF